MKRILCVFLFFILHSLFYFLFFKISPIITYVLTVIVYTLLCFWLARKGGLKK